MSIAPNHNFSVGDIVAYNSPGPATSSSDSSGSSGVSSSSNCLKYGKVISVSNSDNILQVSKLKIKIGQQSSSTDNSNSADGTMSLLTTEVYTFSSARHTSTSYDKKSSNKSKNPFSKLVKKASQQIMGNGNTTSSSIGGPNPSQGAADSSNSNSIEDESDNVDVSDALYSLMSRAGIPVSMESKSMVDRILELETLNRRLEEETNIAR